MRNYFTFDGKNSSDFGLYISGGKTWGSADRDIETVRIPGKNGDLHIDNNRYKNKPIEYKNSFLVGNFETAFPEMRDFFALRGDTYYRLTDTYHPDEFRLARYSGGLGDPKVRRLNHGGQFTIKFDCDPRRFLNSGDEYISVNSSGTVTNPASFPSLPLIEVTGSGTFTINGTGITISSYSDPVTMLDFETANAYYQDDNLNQYVTRFDGITLNPGTNSIVLPAGMMLRIKGRWWTV